MDMEQIGADKGNVFHGLTFNGHVDMGRLAWMNGF